MHRGYVLRSSPEDVISVKEKRKELPSEEPLPSEQALSYLLKKSPFSLKNSYSSLARGKSIYRQKQVFAGFFHC